MPLRPARFVTFRLALGKALVLSLSGVALGMLRSVALRLLLAGALRATWSRSRVCPIILLVPRRQGRETSAHPLKSVLDTDTCIYALRQQRGVLERPLTHSLAEHRLKRAATQHLLSDHVGQALQELGPFYKQKL
jgi:hypothetical protein